MVELEEKRKNDMSLIPEYPAGSDITLLETSYTRKKKDYETGKLSKDFLSLTYRDNVTGKKHNHVIYQPKYTYYKLDKAYNLDHHLLFIDKEKVVPVTAKYSDILKSIAEETDNLDFFYDNINAGNRQENRKLNALNEVFMSDMDVEDYYRMLFDREYKNEPFKLNKSFFDIEVDTKNMMGDFPEMGECPINAIAFCDERTSTVYQLLLRDESNPLIAQYEAIANSKEHTDELKKFIELTVGKKRYIQYGLNKMEYKFLFFDEEIELIYNMFHIINQLSPDIAMIWNMAFDLQYVIERIKALGYDPKGIMCDERLKESFVKYYYDERNKNDLAERGDYFNISQFTVWLDQMIQFASRRKGRGAYPSFKLDDIGYLIAKIKKLDYSHITTSITMLPYLDFKVFSWYNVIDTLVQKCIETKTGDADYTFAKALMNNTRYQKVHRQSVYLANRFTKDFYDYGFVIGNNINKWNEKPSMKYPGAMVGDPLHNSIYAMIMIDGRPTLLAANVVDYDYKSLYPSITIENNMAPNTQVGYYEIPMSVSYNEHPDMFSSSEEEANYSRSGEFLENMMSDNHIEFCKRWLHLGDFKDIMNDARELFETQEYEIPVDWSPDELVYFSGKEKQELVEFYQDDYNNHNSLVTFYDTRDDYGPLIDTIKQKAFI